MYSWCQFTGKLSINCTYLNLWHNFSHGLLPLGPTALLYLSDFWHGPCRTTIFTFPQAFLTRMWHVIQIRRHVRCHQWLNTCFNTGTCWFTFADRADNGWKCTNILIYLYTTSNYCCYLQNITSHFCGQNQIEKLAKSLMTSFMDGINPNFKYYLK